MLVISVSYSMREAENILLTIIIHADDSGTYTQKTTETMIPLFHSQKIEFLARK